MKKLFVIGFVCLVRGSLIFSQELNTTESDSNNQNNVITQEKQKPNYADMMLLNGIVPGTAQLSLGQPEGYFYLSALPLSIIGNGLILYYYFGLQGGVDVSLATIDAKSYLFSFNKRDPQYDWVLYTGTVFTLYSTLFAEYSSWAAHRDYIDRYGSEQGFLSMREGRESLFDLASAPFRYENVLNIDVLPALTFLIIPNLTPESLTKTSSFFLEDKKMWGITMNPWAAFSSKLVMTALLVTANATWEEIFFRGLILERSGQVYSQLSFGLGHLPNMLMPGVSVEDTILQSIFATAYGFYASDRVINNEYKLERMIALHFWNNVIAMMFNYLENPESSSGFYIKFAIKY